MFESSSLLTGNVICDFVGSMEVVDDVSENLQFRLGGHRTQLIAFHLYHSTSCGELQVAPNGNIELAHLHRSAGKQSKVHSVQCLKLIFMAVE